jgi:hypothetical protein
MRPLGSRQQQKQMAKGEKDGVDRRGRRAGQSGKSQGRRMGSLGAEQLAWLADDLKGKSASTPIVLFAHIPLWTVAAEWGWGTDDSVAALGFVKRFGSVTVLNGRFGVRPR